MTKYMAIGDFHFSRKDNGNKIGTQAGVHLGLAVQRAIDLDVDLIVNFGDNISVGETPEDHAIFSKVIDNEFSRAAHIPQLRLAGNHEQYYNPELPPSTILDIGGYRFIAYQTSTVRDKNGEISIPRDQLDWLQKTLQESDKPVILLQHIGSTSFAAEKIKPPSSRYFPHYYKNDAEAMEIILGAGNVILCNYGHRHTRQVVLSPGNRLPYHVTNPSLTHSFNGVASGAHTLFEIDSRAIRISHFGLDNPPDQTLLLQL